ncbi:hypothetical protein C4L39_17960 [Clostridium diolis]|nr:hypothetical protein C4L39_17960 [Clostridium diolis]
MPVDESNNLNKEHTIRIRVDEETKEKLNKITEEKDTSISEIVRQGIEQQYNNIDGAENYLQYRLYGFNNLILTDNFKYSIDNELIKNIRISDNVKTMTVELKDNIRYEENSQTIETFLNHICFNLIIKTEADIYQPVRVLEVIKESGSIMKLKDKIQMKESVTFIRNYPARVIYDRVMNSRTAIDKNFVKYDRIFKTLHNPNPIAQFMSLYQFLMELLSKGKSKVEQRNVVDYIKDNKNRYEFVYFKPTRRINRNFEEDCFTYIRNEIGHSEETNDLELYKELGSNISQNLIKNLILIINDAILESED